MSADPAQAPPGSGHPDLRLAGVALGAWLSALTVLHLDGRRGAVIALVAAAGAAGGWRLLSRPGRRRDIQGRANRGRASQGRDILGLAGRGGNSQGRGGQRGARRWSVAGVRRWGWVVLSVLLGVVCGSAATAARVAVRDAEPLAGLAASRASVRAWALVRDDPRPVGGGTGRATVLVPAELTRLVPASGAAVRTRARILILASGPSGPSGTGAGWDGLLPGQRLVVSGRLAPSRGGDLRAAVLTVTTGPRLIGRPGRAQRAAGDLRAGLRRACDPLPDEPGGLLPGLVVGDTSRLPPVVAEDFRATGLTHLVAVSGANVAIIVGLVLMLARWCRVGPRIAVLASTVALVGFVVLARPSPSVVRAAVMGAIGLLALATGRPRAAVPALCAAVTVLLVVDPELAGHAGFALSVLATGGLLLLAPRWRDALRARGVPAGVAEALAVPASAQVACGPVVAALSGTVSVVAVPANLLVVPAIAPATVLGVAAAAVSPVWPAGAEFLAWLGGWPARWLVTVARYGADLPASALPWPPGVAGGLLLAGVTVSLLFAIRWTVVRRLAAVLVIALVFGALPVRLVATGWPPVGWVAVACAVGQGDATALSAGRAAAVVVDAGAEPASTDRCLRRLGVRRVPLLLISHFHADHVGGVDGVFRHRTVGVVAGPAWPEPVAGRTRVVRAATARGVAVRTVVVGWSYTLGELRLTALGAPWPLRGTRSDPNNNSLVLLAVVRGVRVLLPGDAEGEEQRAVAAYVRDGWPATSPIGLRSAVLKLPHHGSIYQDPAFLSAVDPRVVLVSVGTGNRYGHPNASVLARLTRDGARVLRTDVDGDVAAVRSDGGLTVVVRGRDPGGATS